MSQLYYKLKSNAIKYFKKLSGIKLKTGIPVLIVRAFLFTIAAVLMIITFSFILQGCDGSAGLSGLTDSVTPSPGQTDTSAASDESTAVADNTGTDTSDKNLLIAGSDTTFPPFDFIDNGQITGFDIDLINEIAVRIEKEIQVVSINWDPEFKQLQEGELDLIISAVPYNEDKDSIVDFSEPYFTMKYLLMSLVGSDITVRENLYGRNVGMLESGKDAIDEEYLADFNIVYFRDILEMLDALKNKEIEGVLMSLPIAVNLLKENMDMYYVFEEVPASRDFVIVFAEGSNLRQSMDAALDEIKQDGTYDTIYNKWFNYNSVE